MEIKHVTIKEVFLMTTAGLVYLIEVDGEKGQCLLIPQEVFDKDNASSLAALKFKTDALGLRTCTDVRSDPNKKFFIVRLVKDENSSTTKTTIH